jgi:hypothetical protein
VTESSSQLVLPSKLCGFARPGADRLHVRVRLNVGRRGRRAGERFFRHSVWRAGAGFSVCIIASKVGPAQMGPFVHCKRGGGLFCLIRTTENRPICVRGNDLSQHQTGGWPGHHTPGVEAIGKAGPHGRLIAVRFSFAVHVCLLDRLA